MWKVKLILTEVGQEGECKRLNLDLLCARCLLVRIKKYMAGP